MTFESKTELKAPNSMFRSCDATVSSAINVAFFRPAHTNKIYAFNNTGSPSMRFSQLPDCPLNSCSMVMIDDSLTTVGGYLHSGEHFNKLFSFVGTEDGYHGTWEDILQCLPSVVVQPRCVLRPS